jgi:hypothetical protein
VIFADPWELHETRCVATKTLHPAIRHCDVLQGLSIQIRGTSTDVRRRRPAAVVSELCWDRRCLCITAGLSELDRKVVDISSKQTVSK